MTNIDYAPAGPVARSFHQSKAFVRGLMGPVGSGKSSASWMEVMIRATSQAPDSKKIRRTRWAVLRNTYPELKSTTIKTAQEWAPMMVMKWDAPISGVMDFWLPDKTRVKIEVYFLALERPEDVGKLKSLELTGAWMNEAGEMAKQVFDMVTQRVGRYPPVKDGGPSWSGVILDTNPPDTDHWWYRMFEEQKPKDFEVFKQPGGLIERGGVFLPNLEAENTENLNGGHDYYTRQLAAKSKEWIKVFLCGQYGTVIDGKPVYPEYNDDLHCREIEAIEGKELLIGLDYGLTPAAVICQMSPTGQFLVLDELCAEDMGISQFARDILKPHMTNTWRGYSFAAVGDPAGNRRADSDEKTCFMELAEAGIAAVPAISNDFLKRREAVAKYLTRLVAGKAALLVHPRCTRVRKGFLGGYCFKRLQMAGEKYRDVAEKNMYSHCFPGFVQVSTPRGRVRIDALRIGDEVSTPLGPRRISATMNRATRDLVRLTVSNAVQIVCTADHPFILPRNGVVLADALQYGDVLYSEEESQCANAVSTLSRLSTTFATTSNPVAITSVIQGTVLASVTCIAQFGCFTMGRFQSIWKSITRITTSRTTGLPILSCANAVSTPVTTGSYGHRAIQKWSESTWRVFALLPRNGMAPRLAKNGIASTPSGHGSNDKQSGAVAYGANRATMSLWDVRREDFALQLVSLLRGARAALTTWSARVRSAGLRLWSIVTRKQEPALRIVGNERLVRRAPIVVYDLTVEDAHCFYANGILVSNCHDALQYAALFTQFLDTASFVKKIEYREKVI